MLTDLKDTRSLLLMKSICRIHQIKRFYNIKWKKIVRPAGARTQAVSTSTQHYLHLEASEGNGLAGGLDANL